MKLLQFESGERTQPAVLYARPVGTAQVGYSLARPSEPHAEIRDIKERLADRASKPWMHAFDKSQARVVEWSLLARRMIELSAKSAGVTVKKSQSVWVLLPSFRDQESHNHYRNAIRKAVVEALGSEEVYFLVEPEMVLEYFRLVRRNLPRPTEEGNPLYLVIDCGALTCNVSLVIGNRDGVSTAKEGRWRGVLQPISGATKRAGRWVDEEIAKHLAESLPSAPPGEVLRLAEAAKVSLSREKSITLRRESDHTEIEVTRDVVAQVGELLWAACRDELEQLLAVAYRQLSNPDAYNGTYAEMLRNAGIQSPAGLVKLLSGVVFAGGTSQLPGFRESAVRFLGWTGETLNVGEEYAAVPVLGAAAHVLQQSGKLSWSGGRQEKGEDDAQPDVMLRSITDDIVLRAAFGSAKHVDMEVVPREGWSTGLARDEQVPFPDGWTDQEGKVALVYRTLLPNGKHQHVKPRGGARWHPLAPGQKGRSRLAISVKDGTIGVRTVGTTPPTAHYVDLKKITDTPPPSRVRPPRAHSESPVVVTEAGEDVFLDFGMSKLAFATIDQAVLIGPDHFAKQAVVPIPQLPSGWSIASDEPNKFDELAHARERASQAEREAERARGTAAAAEAARSLEATARTAAEQEAAQLRTALDGLRAQHAALQFAEQAARSESETLRAQLRATEQETGVARRSQRALFKRVPCMEPPAGRSARSEADERAFFDETVRYVAGTGLSISREQLLHLHLSAKTSSLVLLAGAPGVGKSALVRRYANALGLSNQSGNVERVPVEASWTNSTGILGDPRSTDGSLPTFLQLACRSVARTDELFVALLDECNLAHMDYYLAPVLSAMEDDGSVDVGAESPLVLPIRAPYHRILTFGTLNVDDAGTTLTDKVLDRACILELDEAELGATLPTDARAAELPPMLPAALWSRYCELDNQLPVPPDLTELWRALRPPSGRSARAEKLSAAAASRSPHLWTPLGRRVARQICAYVSYARRIAPPGEEDQAQREALDIQLLTRILPRMRGDDRMLPLLERLWQLCMHDERLWVRSAARLERMYTQLTHDHAFDFWTS